MMTGRSVAGVVLAEDLEDLEAVEPRHHHVEQDHVERPLADQRQRVLAVVADGRLVPERRSRRESRSRLFASSSTINTRPESSGMSTFNRGV